MRLLQSWGVEDYPESIEDFLELLLSGYTGVVPMEVLATFVFGSFAIVSFIRSDSPIIPLGMVMLTGASILPMVAPIALGPAVIGVLIFPTGVMTLAWYVYSD